MYDFLLQTIIPFILSALVVIIITIIAEKFGTKVGGILGTMPTTIIIAFIFIALNKGVNFASKSVAIVPAEMGINLVFLLVFVILAYKSLIKAIFGSMIIWAILSTILYFYELANIMISILIYLASLICIFYILEKKLNIKSTGKITVHYTPPKIFFRGLLAGTIIAISVFLSNTSAALSGIFSIFPAIFSSTMIITAKEHGPDFSAGIAKSMIFGSMSVMSYAFSIHFLYPLYGIVIGTIIAFLISTIVTLVLFKSKEKIR